jgi:hypothetical protein
MDARIPMPAASALMLMVIFANFRKKSKIGPNVMISGLGNMINERNLQREFS